MIKSNTRNLPGSPPGVRQGGAILVLYVAGLVAILAMAGLALDGSHSMLNKTRLQNTTDSAALAAAKVLDQTGDQAQSRAAALSLFGENAQDLGNVELNNSYSGGDIQVTVQFSNTVNPFAPGTGPANYVRVISTGFTMPAWFIRVVGITQRQVTATAVAGTSPTINNACNLVPLIICGDPAAGGPLWGYQDDQVEVLKGGSDSGSQSGEIGPGNFQLARLGDSAGGADVRENLAGGYEGCVQEGDSIPTEPGNTVGPVVQGINTRLNMYSGPISPSDYPPDVITEEQSALMTYDGTTVTLNGSPVNTAADLDFNYDDYLGRLGISDFDVPPASGGAFDRRNMPVMIADCTGINNGQTDLPLLGIGCFFLLQRAVQHGLENELYGEFVDDCAAQGQPGPNPTIIPGPDVIQLYHDSDSFDS